MQSSWLPVGFLSLAPPRKRMTSRTSAQRMPLRSGRYRPRLGLSSLTRVSPTMRRRLRVGHSTGLFGTSALKSVVWLMTPNGGNRRRQCPRINWPLQIRIGVPTCRHRLRRRILKSDRGTGTQSGRCAAAPERGWDAAISAQARKRDGTYGNYSSRVN